MARGVSLGCCMGRSVGCCVGCCVKVLRGGVVWGCCVRVLCAGVVCRCCVRVLCAGVVCGCCVRVLCAGVVCGCCVGVLRGGVVWGCCVGVLCGGVMCGCCVRVLCAGVVCRCCVRVLCAGVVCGCCAGVLCGGLRAATVVAREPPPPPPRPPLAPAHVSLSGETASQGINMNDLGYTIWERTEHLGLNDPLPPMDLCHLNEKMVSEEFVKRCAVANGEAGGGGGGCPPPPRPSPEQHPSQWWAVKDVHNGTWKTGGGAGLWGVMEGPSDNPPNERQPSVASFFRPNNNPQGKGTASCEMHLLCNGSVEWCAHCPRSRGAVYWGGVVVGGFAVHGGFGGQEHGSVGEPPGGPWHVARKGKMGHHPGGPGMQSEPSR